MLEQLRTDLKLAMQRRDKREMAVIRLLIGAIGNAEAQTDAGAEPTVGLGNEVARRVLTGDEIHEVLNSELAAFHQAASEYDAAGRPDRGSELRIRAAIVQRYLP